MIGNRIAERLIVAGVLLGFAVTGAAAQGKGQSCVTDLKKEYGTAAAVSPNCAGEYDCTFMAPPGNASARALMETIAQKAESCFTGAGLSMSKEVKDGPGTTRYFSEAGQERCALLIAAPSGPPPEGVRAVCKTD
jgi:hypothetical protein